MNTFRTIAMGLCILTLSFIAESCTTGQNKDIKFKPLVVKKEVPLINGQAKPSCSVDVSIDFVQGDESYAERINKQIVQTVFRLDSVSPKQAVDSFVICYIAQYRDELMPFYKAEKGNLEQNWYAYSYKLRTSEKNGHKNVLCYTAEKTTFEGSTHQLHTVQCLNFDRRNGMLVTLAGVLKSDCEKQLNKLLFDALLEHFQCTTRDDLSKHSVLMNSEIYVPDNYLILGDGIEFIYNEFEIAPYEAGTIRLKISNNKLKPILKEIKD
jgi:hypothetical protein